MSDILTSSKGDGGRVVRLVQNLVRDYIKDENALVLLARPVNVDAHNSTAASFVEEEGAEERCIGMSACI